MFWKGVIPAKLFTEEKIKRWQANNEGRSWFLPPADKWSCDLYGKWATYMYTSMELFCASYFSIPINFPLQYKLVIYFESCTKNTFSSPKRNWGQDQQLRFWFKLIISLISFLLLLLLKRKWLCTLKQTLENGYFKCNTDILWHLCNTCKMDDVIFFKEIHVANLLHCA